MKPSVIKAVFAASLVLDCALLLTIFLLLHFSSPGTAPDQRVRPVKHAAISLDLDLRSGWAIRSRRDVPGRSSISLYHDQTKSVASVVCTDQVSLEWKALASQAKLAGEMLNGRPGQCLPEGCPKISRQSLTGDRMEGRPGQVLEYSLDLVRPDGTVSQSAEVFYAVRQTGTGRVLVVRGVWLPAKDLQAVLYLDLNMMFIGATCL